MGSMPWIVHGSSSLPESSTPPRLVQTDLLWS
ncbi:hypothetical protein M3J09_002591 [Ascochyta lentis]